jgi:SAM-dependent methyltransferase
VPVLIDEEKSIFNLDAYEKAAGQLLAPPSRNGRFSQLKETFYRLLPDVNSNLAASANYARFARLLLEKTAKPRVLIVGGREVGRGLEMLLQNEALELVETDIDFGPRTELICDAHQLPFADGSFDGLIAQAVLEHVLDPWRSAEELHRVLKKEGLVYAETPFLQRRHGGRFDFTRFTFLGHRRLFRRFDEIDSGAAVGPGVALAWQYNGWLLSFSDRKSVRALLRVFGRLSSFWLKYLDRLLARNEAALDSASGFYFLGRRSETALSDRELLAGFRGIE